MKYRYVLMTSPSWFEISRHGSSSAGMFAIWCRHYAFTLFVNRVPRINFYAALAAINFCTVHHLIYDKGAWKIVGFWRFWLNRAMKTMRMGRNKDAFLGLSPKLELVCWLLPNGAACMSAWNKCIPHNTRLLIKPDGSGFELIGANAHICTHSSTCRLFSRDG